MTEGIHYGYPPGCAPQLEARGGVPGFITKVRGEELWYPQTQWRHKPALYLAGAEFVIFDMEHTGWSIETIRRLLATTPAGGPVPFVRVPAVEYHFIARVLDCGAMGLMFPMVETVTQAETIEIHADPFFQRMRL